MPIHTFIPATVMNLTWLQRDMNMWTTQRNVFSASSSSGEAVRCLKEQQNKVNDDLEPAEIKSSWNYAKLANFKIGFYQIWLVICQMQFLW